MTGGTRVLGSVGSAVDRRETEQRASELRDWLETARKETRAAVETVEALGRAPRSYLVGAVDLETHLGGVTGWVGQSRVVQFRWLTDRAKRHADAQ